MSVPAVNARAEEGEGRAERERERGLTAGGVGVGVMELEGDALDEVADVVCAADDGGVGEGGGAADGDGPAVGVVRGRELLAVFLGEDDGGVAVDDGAVDGDALGWVRVSRRRRRRRRRGDSDGPLRGRGRWPCRLLQPECTRPASTLPHSAVQTPLSHRLSRHYHHHHHHHHYPPRTHNHDRRPRLQSVSLLCSLCACPLTSPF